MRCVARKGSSDLSHEQGDRLTKGILIVKLFENLPLPPVYYHGREASYWREDDRGGWIKINESAVRLFVADHGYAKNLMAK